MSLILCRKEPVKRPFYMENLGIHLYSSQELCYVIYQYPLLCLDGFVDEELLTFIRDELDMGLCALKMERAKQSGESSEELLYLYLQECSYYNANEINRYKQQISAIRKLPVLEYQKQKADYLFGFKQYGKAIILYEKILEEIHGKYGDAGFWSRVCYNLGAAFARQCQFERAMSMFEKAYGLSKNQEILKRMYFITTVAYNLELKERYKSLITELQKNDWDKERESASNRAKEADSLKKLDTLFEKDSIKRLAGASQMISEWKQEYRSMVSI